MAAAAPPPPARGPTAAPSASTSPTTAPSPATATNGYLSPVVRALLAEHGLAPGAITGSGRDGRITRANVLAVVANGHRAPTAPTAPPPPAATTATSPAGPAPAVLPVPQPGPDDEVIDFTKARRATAAHMVASLRTSAHTLVATEVDYHGVDAVRRANQLSFLPFVARAAIDAIAEFPHVNASVGDDVLIVHPRIHLGVAVDVDFQALVVPVVRDAGAKRLRAIADEVGELATRARTKRLNADDLTGGTFTITNVGSYGTLVTGPIINQPQVGILSTDGVKMKPVALRTEAGDWSIVVHPVGNLCLSFDHRAYDGAYASAFLARVREILETRDWTSEV